MNGSCPSYRRPHTGALLLRLLLLPLLLHLAAPRPASAAPPAPFSPTALVALPDGRSVLVAGATAPGLHLVDVQSPAVLRTFQLTTSASGLTLSHDGTVAVVTSPGPAGEVTLLELPTGRRLRSFPAGHTPMSPVLSRDGSRLFVCLRFQDAVAVLDPATGREITRIPVAREPVAAALTPDERHLLVANHLHHGRADVAEVGAVVSVIEVASGRVIKELRLPNGSGALNDLRISPDGRYAAVTHILARFHLPTTQLERGWMNTNAETLIDLSSLEILNTVLLDAVDAGAANPWGVAWTADGRTQIVTHAGTHEVSLIDFPALLARLDQLPAKPDPTRPIDPNAASRVKSDVPNDLAFLVGIRRRVHLPPTDRGPRSVALAGDRIVTANYFSDSLTTLDPVTAQPTDTPACTSIVLGPMPPPSQARLGEAFFHDATLCFQGWQSCASCHPGDARVDALNWDLLNDDIGNPKNNKSLLLAHRTPPAMSLAVRDSAEVAVRAGIRHILFTVQPDSVASAIDAYLKGLQPVPSPRLEDGHLSSAARRGRRIFADSRVGCATCHPPGLFTDLKHYDVGTRASTDQPTDIFDTPTLVEVWRTAPYLHDGSVTSLEELFTSRNQEDRHGKTSHLNPRQILDLVEYVLSL